MYKFYDIKQINEERGRSRASLACLPVALPQISPMLYDIPIMTNTGYTTKKDTAIIASQHRS